MRRRGWRVDRELTSHAVYPGFNSRSGRPHVVAIGKLLHPVLPGAFVAAIVSNCGLSIAPELEKKSHKKLKKLKERTPSGEIKNLLLLDSARDCTVFKLR